MLRRWIGGARHLARDEYAIGWPTELAATVNARDCGIRTGQSAWPISGFRQWVIRNLPHLYLKPMVNYGSHTQATNRGWPEYPTRQLVLGVWCTRARALTLAHRSGQPTNRPTYYRSCVVYFTLSAFQSARTGSIGGMLNVTFANIYIGMCIYGRKHQAVKWSTHLNSGTWVKQNRRVLVIRSIDVVFAILSCRLSAEVEWAKCVKVE